jgi:hypothetical protein
MSIQGVVLPAVDLTITLPKTRKDGSELALSDIKSVTILRNSADWKVLEGQFSATVNVADLAPATGSDTYSFYVTDTAGVRSDVSPAATVTVGEPLKAPASTGTLTAVTHEPKEPAKPSPQPIPVSVPGAAK